MEEMCFSLFLPVNTMKSPGRYMQNKNKKIPKGGEKKADLLGTVDPRNNIVESSLGCCCCFGIISLIEPELGTEETGSLQSPRDTDKSPTKSIFSSQRTRKGAV